MIPPDERMARYADAIDSVLADEFLTRAVTPVVVAVADAEVAELRTEVEALRRDYAELMSVTRAQGAHCRESR